MRPGGKDPEVIGIRTRLMDPQAELATLKEFARVRGGWAQILDAGHVAGRDHIVAAYEHARRAIKSGTNATGSLEMELLLYASGERQISKAIERIGARAGRPFVAVVSGLTADEVLLRFGWTRDDRILKATPAKLHALGFTAAEIKAAGPAAHDLAFERVARVDLAK